jgi:hypothetical protein
MPKNHANKSTQRDTKNSYPFDFESKMDPSIVDLSTVLKFIFKKYIGCG